ncbi:MAG: Ppx/GppA phosphatase family protein [Alphaproteobacteria bacterium]|nr:Ppx/GppA phosphatase family protein [Alphaproteobacteria bacterium]
MARPPKARRSSRRAGPWETSKLYAALDLGTNNCRLLIAERGASGGLRVVDSYSQIVRLGEGLARTGQLSEAAMVRAIEALGQCVAKVNRHKPVEARYVATQACRAASNGRAFLNEVQRSTGLRMETITPKEEARYALLGSMDLIDPSSDFALVIDIGGGSTELCWVDAKSAAAHGVEGCARRPPILGWASFPIGVVTLAESFEDTAPGWYSRMVEHVRARLQQNDAASRFGPLFAAGRGQLIGNSGTVTSLAGVHLRLERYQRAAVDGIWLSRHEAEQARLRLHDATPAQRAAEPCIGPQRADLVLAGCAILDAVWSLWPADRLRVGDRGLREGMLLSMMHRASGGGSRRTRPGGRQRSQVGKPAGPGA